MSGAGGRTSLTTAPRCAAGAVAAMLALAALAPPAVAHGRSAGGSGKAGAPPSAGGSSKAGAPPNAGGSGKAGAPPSAGGSGEAGAPPSAGAARIPDPGRVHWSIGGGGFLDATGPSDGGVIADGELYPGGGLGRIGFRLEARGFGGFNQGWFAGGISYVAGAARPHLVIALHAEGGVWLPDPRVVAGGGLQIQGGVIGAIAVGLDGAAHIIINYHHTQLVVSAALTLRFAG